MSAPRLLAVLSLALVAACPEPERAPVTFVIPSEARGAFLDTPFPSDLLIRADGTLDLRTVKNPFNSSTLEDYLRIFQSAERYAGTSTLYFHVDGGVDEASLPQTPADSIADDASMFVVDIDGPEASTRRPIEWRHYKDGTAFLPPGTVAVNLLLGAVPAGRYALVVTSKALRADGVPLGPSDDLRRMLTCEAPITTDRTIDCAPYAEVFRTLGRSGFFLSERSVPIYDVALVNVITPQDSSAGLKRAYDVAKSYQPVVSDVQLRATGQNDLYFLYEGTIRVAQYQAGDPPFDNYDGVRGGFIVDADGAPIIQREEDIQFTLTVPKGQMPPNGWPVAINGHGTGGSLDSGLGTRRGAEAFHLTNAGVAMFAISEPLHRTREGFVAGNEELATFNFFNPVAGRDNWRQSALEKVQQVTALRSLTFTGANNLEVRFDENNVSYFGHSQGGIVGALFVGIEDRITGAFLSGAGAGFAPSLIEKTEPIVIANVLRLALQIPADEPIDTFHPVPSLLQTFVDAADPLNYGRAWRHRSGRRTPHLVATSGLLDTFTPKRNHSGLAGSFGLPLAAPVFEPLPILDVQGLETTGSTSSGNLVTDDGEPLTAALVQYPQNGHFAVFENPAAQLLLETFFRTLTSGVPTTRTQGD